MESPQIMNKIQKDQKPYCHFWRAGSRSKALGANVGDRSDLHSTPPKGWVNDVSHSSSPSPGLTSTPSYIRNQLVPFSLVAQMVKNLPAMWETWVQYLGWEDPLEKGMATHFNILAWKSQPVGSQKVDNWAINTYLLKLKAIQLNLNFREISNF